MKENETQQQQKHVFRVILKVQFVKQLMLDNQSHSPKVSVMSLEIQIVNIYNWEWDSKINFLKNWTF